jgi:ElaB/YqjD/DUF883 family membrane-anchored ribosome-binding protein
MRDWRGIISTARIARKRLEAVMDELVALAKHLAAVYRASEVEGRFPEYADGLERIAAALPSIRREALEEAARVAETVPIMTYCTDSYARQVAECRTVIAAAIRALINKESA